MSGDLSTQGQIRFIANCVSKKRMRLISLGEWFARAFIAFAAVVFGATLVSAQDTSATFGPVSTPMTGGAFSVTIDVGTRISGDATLSLTGIYGDLNNPGETINVTVDGVFVASVGSLGGDNCTNGPDQTLTIPKAILEPLLGDGKVTLYFQASATVDMCEPRVRLGGRLIYPGPTAAQQQMATANAIQGFLSKRASLMASGGPDMSAQHQQLAGSAASRAVPEAATMPPAAHLGGGLASGGREATSGSGGVGQSIAAAFGASAASEGRFSFSKSYLGAQRERAGAPDNHSAALPKLNVWTQGTFAYYEQDGRKGSEDPGHFGLLYLGADYMASPGIIVGGLVQFDWMNDNRAAGSVDADGKGWMAGPYASILLDKNLFFDVRAEWGRSQNRTSPLGTYVDHFDTERALFAARLIGSTSYVGLNIRPSLDVTYYRETQQAYTNANGVNIPNHTVPLGRLSIGSQFSHLYELPNGYTFEPSLGLTFMWDFEKTAMAPIEGFVAGNRDIRGAVSLGTALTTPSGTSLKATATYNGIGDPGFDSYAGQVFLILPIN